MTDLRPYREYTEISVVLAIAQGRSPANPQDIVSPEFLHVVLERCWQLSSQARPTMIWCTEVLWRHTTGLFDAHSEEADPDIPLVYESQGEDWNTIHNPEANADSPIVDTVGPIRMKCVIALFMIISLHSLSITA